MKPNFDFRATLLKIQDLLSEDDRKSLHFLFGDDVPKYLREDTSLGGALRVLDALIERAHISEEDCGYLIKAFKTIGCHNAAQRLQAYWEAHQRPWNQQSVSIQDLLRDMDQDGVEEDRVPWTAPLLPKPDQVVDVGSLATSTDSTTPEKSPSDTANQIGEPVGTSSCVNRRRKGSWNACTIVLPITVALLLLFSVLLFRLHFSKSGNQPSQATINTSIPVNSTQPPTPLNCNAEKYKNEGNYSEALRCYKELLEIQQKKLSKFDPARATLYSNIGEMYLELKAYSRALFYHTEARDIREMAELGNIPDRATSYYNLGLTHEKMGNYSAALNCCEKSLDDRTSILPANHLDIAMSYNCIGEVYYNQKNYSKALEYYEKTHEILEETQPPRPAHLTDLYKRIALVCKTIGNDFKAPGFCERTRRFWDQTTANPRVRHAGGR